MKKLMLMALVPFVFACSSKKAEEKVEEVKSEAVETINNAEEKVITDVEAASEVIEKKSEELENQVDELIKDL